MSQTFADEEHEEMQFAYGFCSKNYGDAAKEFS
jgi:hypothetical protein